MTAPVDFSMALAQGFHNLPVLYGQKVRKVEHVKGFCSGLKIGGKVISAVNCFDSRNLALASTMD